MSARRQRKKPIAAPSYPYELVATNPVTGKPWALDEKTLRALLAHCLSEPVFAARDNGADEFIAWADWEVGAYRKALQARPQLVTLQRIERHARELRKALTRLQSAWQANEYQDDWGMWIRCARQFKVNGEPINPVRDLFALDATAYGARLMLPRRGRGQRDTSATMQRHLLINRLWRRYPESLRDLALRGHFVETLRLILGRPQTDAALRAVQMDARRARAAAVER